MYQEGVLPLALVYAHDLLGNRWYKSQPLREWIIAGLRYSAESCHADGSCDDYYPFERALGAAVFSFCAATEAARLIELSDRDADNEPIFNWLRLRARWIGTNGESGTLANHHALAALGLFRFAALIGESEFAQTAAQKLAEVLDMQHDEGWFCEYGGADPGYQTVTIDCLAKIRAILAENPSLARAASEHGCTTERLEDSLVAAVDFCELFIQPDGGFGGAYGSRGTLHFYPHGFELLAGGSFRAAKPAARLAHAFRHALEQDAIGHFDDDRMFVHRLGNLIEAYLDAADSSPPLSQRNNAEVRQLEGAGLLVVRDAKRHAVVSSARGGVFAWHSEESNSHIEVGTNASLGDAGLIVEFGDGRIAVSQSHDREREVAFHRTKDSKGERVQLTVQGPLHIAKFETVTPFKQSVLHIGMMTIGRFVRTLVRKVLQRRVITGRRQAPLTLTRKFEFVLPSGSSSNDTDSEAAFQLRVTDRIELTDPEIFLKRISYGIGFEAAYVAASGVYRNDQLRTWPTLDADLAVLNADRRVEIVREFPARSKINSHKADWCCQTRMTTRKSAA